MKKFIMKKFIVMVCLGAYIGIPAFSQAENSMDLAPGSIDEEENNWSIAPMLNYEYISLESQQYMIAGTGLFFFYGNQNPPVSEERNSLMFSAFYRPHFLMQEREYLSPHHGIEISAEYKIKKHQFLGLLNGLSSDPLYGGGMHTFQAGVGYAYELIRNERFNFVLGGGIGVGDYGEFNGITLNLIPAPIIRFSMEYPLFSLFFQMLDKPGLSLIIAPESQFRFTGDFRMLSLNFADIQNNLNFECAMWYRFFDDSHKFGDFAGVALGIKNNVLGFTKVHENERFYFVNSYALFGKLDLSFLQLSGGYNFYGYELYDFETKHDAGKGFFVSVQLAYQF